jgi:hypothetical protein
MRVAFDPLDELVIRRLRLFSRGFPATAAADEHQAEGHQDEHETMKCRHRGIDASPTSHRPSMFAAEAGVDLLRTSYLAAVS